MHCGPGSAFDSESAKQPLRFRNGLTRPEVAVLLICLFVLVLLIVPGIFHLRESQRNVACQERMGRLGIALLDYAETHGNRFPPLVHKETPWTQAILPYLKPRPTFLGQITDAPIAEQPPIAAPEFLCPNGRQYEAGRNCYIVNGGWGVFEVDSLSGRITETKMHTVSIDWDYDGSITDRERERSRATGVIWRDEPDDRTSWRLEELDAADGRGQTILHSETQKSRSWMSTETFDLAFVVGRDYLEFGTPPNLFSMQTKSLGPYGMFRIRNLSGGPGDCASPNSLHPDGVNIVFADGASRTLSYRIDPLVYLRLMTPGGVKYGEFRIEQREPD